MTEGAVAGRVIVVTGGGNGIGREYCRDLLANGARVVISDIDAASAAALAEELNADGAERRAVAVRTDVTSWSDAEAMVAAGVAAFGTVDVLVNNAGSYPHVPLEQIDLEAWRRVVSLNLDSVFICTRAVLPVMKAQGSGMIVNVATNLVWSGLANMAHYIAAKSGVVGLTKALARELGVHGITVNAIAPGAVAPPGRLSPSGQTAVDEIIAYQAVKRPQTAADLIGTMRFLCSPSAAFVSGQVITVDGGLTMH